MIFGKPWNKLEIDILNANPSWDTGIIQTQLLKNGFDRTEGAILRKLQRLNKIISNNYVQVSGPACKPIFTYSEEGIHTNSGIVSQTIITIGTKWHTGALPLFGKETRFVMLNDVHVPHNIDLEKIWQFCEDFMPDYLLLVGDIINNDPFSHWDRNSPLRFKTMPQPKAHYELCNKLFFRPAKKAVGPSCKLIYWKGNHEAWSDKAIAEMPEGEGYWEVENNIENIDLWVPSKQVANLGKLHFVHGDIIQGGKYHSLKMLNYFRRNLRYGHYHNMEESSYTSPIDVEDRHTARCCGTLQKPNPSFMGNRPHDWMACITYGVVLANGNFFDNTSIITNNSFMANGKIY